MGNALLTLNRCILLCPLSTESANSLACFAECCPALTVKLWSLVQALIWVVRLTRALRSGRQLWAILVRLVFFQCYLGLPMSKLVCCYQTVPIEAPCPYRHVGLDHDPEGE